MAPAFRLNPSLATSVVKSGWSHIIAGSRDNLQETSGKYMPCHPNINIYNPATYPTFCWCKCIVISFNNIKKCRTLTHPPFLGKPVNLIFVNGKPWAGLSWLNAKQQVIEPIFTWALGPLGTRNNGVTVKIIAISWHQQSPTHEIVIIYIIIYWFIQKIFWFGIIMNYHELSWIIMVYLSRHWFMNSADLPRVEPFRWSEATHPDDANRYPYALLIHGDSWLNRGAYKKHLWTLTSQRIGNSMLQSPVLSSEMVSPTITMATLTTIIC